MALSTGKKKILNDLVEYQPALRKGQLGDDGGDLLIGDLLNGLEVATIATADGGVVAASDATNVPAGGSGTSAGGWDTSGNRDTAITRINDMVTLANELKADYTALRTLVNEIKSALNAQTVS